MAAACRILVVDDEPRGVELLARTLRGLGRVETAVSGERGWEMASLGSHDLIISDQRMPGMSGVELLSRVAERSEHTGRILLTGYSDLGATIEAINRGRVHAYLTKPCSPNDLELSARSVLERVRLTRENERLVADMARKNRELEELVSSLDHAQQRVVASERLAAIGRMIAMIVHDLRGPLALIRSTGNEIVRESDAHGVAATRDLAGEILDETGHMQRMCEELLDVTRASDGDTNRVPCDLDDAVADALAPLLEQVAHTGVEPTLDLRSRSQLSLDVEQLRRALSNLVRNAAEAMPEGGALRVETRREGDMARVSVIDSGPGIPEEIRDRLFEPFVTAGKHNGSGLGLAIVKKVVDDHGGSIEVGKPEGGGTAFHLSLPIDG